MEIHSESLLLMHIYQSVDIQIEVLKIRIQLLKKGKITAKKRLKYINRLRSIKQELERSNIEIYQEDIEYLEDLFVLLGVEGPPPTKQYYNLEKDIHSPIKEFIPLISENETDEQPSYTTPEACKPINLMTRERCGAGEPTKENTYVPRDADEEEQESDS